MDGYWGSLDKSTGEWSGMIRNLVKGDAEVAWSDLTLTLDRNTAVDYLLPIYTDRECVVRKGGRSNRTMAKL